MREKKDCEFTLTESPFHFVRTQGRADITKSCAHMPNWSPCEITAHVLAAMVSAPTSGEEAEACLTHGDYRVRAAAIAMITEHWPRSRGFVDACARMALEDPRGEVRGTALRALPNLRIHAEGVEQSVARVILDRFSLREEELDVAISAAWLDALAEVCQSAASSNDESGIAAEYADKTTKTLEHLLGTEMDEVSSSRAATRRALSSSNNRFRRAALILLSWKWGLNEEDAQRCVRMVVTDPAADVRSEAIGCLVAYYEASKNLGIQQILARIVRDGTCSMEMRDQAYQGLHRVQDTPIEEWPEARRALGEFQFPDDVDWRFVDSFLTSS